MNRSDIDYVIEKLDSYKPDNIYDGYNNVREKQDQRVSEVLDSLKAEFESDYEHGHTPMPKELIVSLSQTQLEDIKQHIEENVEKFWKDHMAYNWIKCSERLPEESDGTVLVCFPDEFPYSNKEPYVNAKHNQRVRIASYSQFNNTWYIGDSNAIGKVRPIAWMLLPEPPEEEEK